MIDWLRKLLAPKWVHRDFGFPRKGNLSEDQLPTKDGWYRVMVSGDSESVDGHTIYAFDDYETWAYFTSHAPDEGGSFVGTHDEDEHTIFAYCGPFFFPEYRYD